MKAGVCESVVEEAALGGLGYTIPAGPDIAPGELTAERETYGDVVLLGRVREAIDRVNPDVPAEAREQAFRKVTEPASPSSPGELIRARRRGPPTAGFRRRLCRGGIR